VLFLTFTWKKIQQCLDIGNAIENKIDDLVAEYTNKELLPTYYQLYKTPAELAGYATLSYSSISFGNCMWPSKTEFCDYSNIVVINTP